MRPLKVFTCFLICVALAHAQADYCQTDNNNVTTICTSCANSTGCSQCAARSYNNPWRVLTSEGVGYNRCLTCDVALNCSSPTACGPGGVYDLPGCDCKDGSFHSTVSLPSVGANGSTVMTTYKGPCISCMAAFNCTNCNANGCLGCPNGKYPCTACQSIDANCVQCYTSGNLTNTCTACKQGYFLNSTGGCSPCSPGCARCTSAAQCTHCARDHDKLINGTCTNCMATFNCSNCDANGCLGCSNGRFESHREQNGRNITVCTACQSIDPNCAQCYTSGALVGTCRNCKKGYFHNATTGGCSACSSGCARCNSATQCTHCANDHARLINGNCTTCATATGDINCSKCTSTGSCTRCKDGYAHNPSTGMCMACSSLVPNCKKCIYNSSGTAVCRECIHGYRGATCTPFVRTGHQHGRS